MNEFYDANTLLALRNAGHINIEEIYNIYEVAIMEDPVNHVSIPTTHVEYLHSNGEVRTDAVDMSLQEITAAAIELQKEQEQAYDDLTQTQN